jgi:hypothetical protein
MICMTQMNEFWTPDTFCECIPPVHQGCWELWCHHTKGEICIICREGFHWLPPPRPLLLVVHERARDELQLRQVIFWMLFAWALVLTLRANWSMTIFPMPHRIRDDL